jgi:CheY-like chemotaxis protein
VSDRDRIGRAPRAEIASREPEAASSVTSAEAARPRELTARGDEPLHAPGGVEHLQDPVVEASRDARSAASPGHVVEASHDVSSAASPGHVVEASRDAPSLEASGDAEASREVALDVAGAAPGAEASHLLLDQGPDTLVERTGHRLVSVDSVSDTPTARHVALALEGARRRASSEATRRPTAPLRGLQDVELLVVDDDDDARWLLARYLERAGARVRTAGSVREADKALARRRPRALVSDIGMPFEDGRTLVARLRRHEAETGLPRLPAIAVTAFVGVRERDASLAAGFDAQLAKPLDPARLVELLRSLLA